MQAPQQEYYEQKTLFFELDPLQNINGLAMYTCISNPTETRHTPQWRLNISVVLRWIILILEFSLGSLGSGKYVYIVLNVCAGGGGPWSDYKGSNIFKI